MKDQINTIREALEAIDNGCQANNLEHTLAALTHLEAMVGSQEPVAWVLYFTNEHGESMRETFFSKAHVERHKAHNENFRGLKCRVEPLYTAAPVAQQYEAADMASAAAQVFRDGVASVAQQPQAEAVPPTHVLVPVEPTDEMIDAACEAVKDLYWVDFVRAYKAAIAQQKGSVA